jgi:hypothetical protein
MICITFIIYIYIYVYMCIFMYMHIYVYTLTNVFSEATECGQAYTEYLMRCQWGTTLNSNPFIIFFQRLFITINTIITIIIIIIIIKYYQRLRKVVRRTQSI